MQPKARVLVFVVSYGAEAFVKSALNRTPEYVWETGKHDIEVLVIDDQSSDRTAYRVLGFRTKSAYLLPTQKPSARMRSRGCSLP